jgi:hypothetical protein
MDGRRSDFLDDHCIPNSCFLGLYLHTLSTYQFNGLLRVKGGHASEDNPERSLAYFRGVRTLSYGAPAFYP